MRFTSDRQRKAVFSQLAKSNYGNSFKRSSNDLSKFCNRFTLKYDPLRKIAYSDDIPNVSMEVGGSGVVDKNLRLFDGIDDRYLSGLDGIVFVDGPLETEDIGMGVLKTHGMYERNPNIITVNTGCNLGNVSKHEVGHHVQQEAFTEDELRLKSNAIEPRFYENEFKGVMDITRDVGSMVENLSKDTEFLASHPELLVKIDGLLSANSALIDKFERNAKLRETKESFADEFESGVEPADEDVEYAKELKEISNPSIEELKVMVK